MTAFAARTVVVGRVPFLVCAPFFHSTLGGAEGIRFVDGVPSALNRELHAGPHRLRPLLQHRIRAAPPRVPALPGHLHLQPAGDEKRPPPFPHHPWEDLGGRSVALSPDSDTSNLLFRILCSRRFHVKPEINAAGSAPEGAFAAAVFIGDKALTESLSGRWPHRYDLADVWAKWQGLPFSFGLWMVRRQALAEKPAAGARFHALLRGIPGLLPRRSRQGPGRLDRGLSLRPPALPDARFLPDRRLRILRRALRNPWSASTAWPSRRAICRRCRRDRGFPG